MDKTRLKPDEPTRRDTLAAPAPAGRISHVPKAGFRQLPTRRRQSSRRNGASETQALVIGGFHTSKALH
jgi:hypothetical protein